MEIQSLFSAQDSIRWKEGGTLHCTLSFSGHHIRISPFPLGLRIAVLLTRAFFPSTVLEQLLISAGKTFKNVQLHLQQCWVSHGDREPRGAKTINL